MEDTFDYEEFKIRTDRGKSVLFLTICYLGYLFYHFGYNKKQFLIGSFSFLSLLLLNTLTRWVLERKSTETQISRGIGTRSLMGWVLIIGVALLGVYFVLAKGVYGSYLLLGEFTWLELLKRILILLFGISLVRCANSSQKALKLLRQDYENLKQLTP